MSHSLILRPLKYTQLIFNRRKKTDSAVEKLLWKVTAIEQSAQEHISTITLHHPFSFSLFSVAMRICTISFPLQQFQLHWLILVKILTELLFFFKCILINVFTFTWQPIIINQENRRCFIKHSDDNHSSSSSYRTDCVSELSLCMCSYKKTKQL